MYCIVCNLPLFFYLSIYPCIYPSIHLLIYLSIQSNLISSNPNLSYLIYIYRCINRYWNALARGALDSFSVTPQDEKVFHCQSDECGTTSDTPSEVPKKDVGFPHESRSFPGSRWLSICWFTLGYATMGNL